MVEAASLHASDRFTFLVLKGIRKRSWAPLSCSYQPPLTIGVGMTSEQTKAKIQHAYVKAVQDRFCHKHRSDNIGHLLSDLRLYGRDAGIDFAMTHLDEIVQEAAETAECKAPCLEMMCRRFGQAALNGIAHTLREHTGLRVDVKRSSVVLVWAEESPSLI